MSTTQNSKVLHAAPDTVYAAFTDPAALVQWQAPGDMKAQIHHFELREGGGYQMSLFYPSSGSEAGKSGPREDRYTSRFVKLIPGQTIIQAIRFETSDAAFQGEMLMEVQLQPVAADTFVTICFRNIPPGIRPQDNEAGTRSSLQKLALYLDTQKTNA